MAGVFLDLPVLWTEETFTINQVIFKKGLPQVVKVSEGYYGNDENESFSSGDFLALDSVKTIKKVVARFADFKQSGFMERNIENRRPTKEIMIPMGYKGKIKILNDNKQTFYYSVAQLIKHFPRYVQAEKCMVVNAIDGPFEIPIGAKLELEKVLDSQGLLCRCNGRDILLKLTDNVKCSLLSDDNTYTLKGVVDKFPLPQFIEIIEPEFRKSVFTDIEEAIHNSKDFSGQLELEDVINQSVIVGHHKPATRNDQSLTVSHRTIAVIPLDSKEIQEIEVQLPLVRDSKIYETIGVRRFTDQTMKIIEEGLYLDIRNVSKVHLLEDDTEPPLIPHKPVKSFLHSSPVLNPKKNPEVRRTTSYHPEDGNRDQNYLPLERRPDVRKLRRAISADNPVQPIGNISYFKSTESRDKKQQSQQKNTNSQREDDKSQDTTESDNWYEEIPDLVQLPESNRSSKSKPLNLSESSKLKKPKKFWKKLFGSISDTESFSPSSPTEDRNNTSSITRDTSLMYERPVEGRRDEDHGYERLATPKRTNKKK